MNYNVFFSKEYLKDLVSNEDVFIDVFKNTQGYILYRCEKEGITVPLNSLRKIENYMSYPLVFNKIIKNPNAKEIAPYLGYNSLKYFNISTDVLFSQDFSNIYKEKYGNNGLVWFSIINSHSFNKPLTIEQINREENFLYSYLHPDNSKYEGYSKCIHWFLESLKRSSKEDLLTLDPRFLSIPNVLDICNEKGVNFSDAPNIGLRSSAGVFYVNGGNSNANLLVQNYKKFSDSYIFSHIDSSIWIDYEKKDKFFDDLNTELKKEIGISIESPKEFYAFFNKNQDFIYYLVTMDENEGFYNEITVKDIWRDVVKNNLGQVWEKIFNLPELKTGVAIENLLNNSSHNPMVSASFKYQKFLNEDNNNVAPSFLLTLNYKEAEALFYDVNSDIKMRSYFNINLQNALKKKDKKLLSVMTKIFCTNFLVEGEYGALSTFNNIKDVEFIKNSISLMPLSLNKHTLARFMLMEIKKNPSNFDFNEKDIDELKEIMKVPDYLKKPLNKYIKEESLTNEELEILKKYGDPEWNNVVSQPDINLLGTNSTTKEINYEKTIWEHQEDPFDVFSVMLDDYVEFVDELDKAFEKNYSDNYLRKETNNKIDNLKSVLNDIQLSSINKDTENIAKKTAKMLKEMLILVNKDAPLLSNSDGYFYLNVLPSIDYSYNATKKDVENDIKIEAVSEGVAHCALFFETLVPEEKEKFIKTVAENLDLHQDLWHSFVVIQDYESSISTFFSLNNLVDSKVGSMISQVVNTIGANYKIKDDKALAESFDLFTSRELFLVQKKTYGEEKFFKIMLEHNPGCAAILKNEENKIAKNWKELESFILRELEINKGKDLFTLGDSAFLLGNLDELSLLPDEIVNIYKNDKDNSNIYSKGNPEGFFEMIENIKSKNPIGYVVALSELNVREFRNSFKDYCLNKSLSDKKIIENCFNPKLYAKGIWDLFESKFNCLQNNEKVKSVQERYNQSKTANIVLNNFYLAQSLNTVLQVNPNLKQECVNELYELALVEKNEKGNTAIKMFDYFLKDENKFQQEDILMLITYNYYSKGIQSMKYRKVNFESFVETRYTEEKENFFNKLDLFQYVLESANIHKELSINIPDNFPVANFKPFAELNSKLPEILEVINNDLTLRKVMNLNINNNDLENENDEDDTNENNFMKL